MGHAVSFKEALTQGQQRPHTDITPHQDDVVLLQYTGGTTGISKGAMLTNKNLLSNMAQISAWLHPFIQKESVVNLSPLPMYHIFAFTVNALSVIHFGIKTVLIINPRDLNSIIKEFKRQPIALMTGLNTLFNALINHK